MNGNCGTWDTWSRCMGTIGVNVVNIKQTRTYSMLIFLLYMVTLCTCIQNTYLILKSNPSLNEFANTCIFHRYRPLLIDRSYCIWTERWPTGQCMYTIAITKVFDDGHMILVCLYVQLIMSLFLLLAFEVKIISTYKTLMYLCVRMRAHAWMYVFGLIFVVSNWAAWELA